MHTTLLGCIADDCTGATDLADTLVRQGMRTVQVIGVPETCTASFEADAVVIALKCRSIAAELAVRQSLESLAWLQKLGCRQVFWKYCSTFDSTPQGNIGPVADALLQKLGGEITVVCPAFPTNKRTVYQGQLFVGDLLLHESSMRYHPVTPMSDANLLRLLRPQVSGKVGLIPWEIVRQGMQAIREALHDLQEQEVRFAVVDAIEDRDLISIDSACADMPLLTGGSGLALGLAENFRRRGMLPLREELGAMLPVPGRSIILAGSCSEATRRQVAFVKDRFPFFRLKPLDLAEKPEEYIRRAIAWAAAIPPETPAFISSNADPQNVRAVQERLGPDRAGRLVEEAFSVLARALQAVGFTRFVVAGGETSGAVLEGLGIRALRIGPRIDPGVPWTTSLESPTIALALKSGNFGGDDFFLKALNFFA
ncbi:hypothetical protein CSB45_14105 [candidate division KSB3 bacterium]|uniref:3-oxo-tetronate kinase n=1 Tax=candidate division KSB3 bacterium TaxID=2044937 RepID=A0A2G6E170_9BACT|nr:MAG: hypothetical protein CSB45_14105 [candidate division KSB3 bacterium]PIE28459.1 MAG: hypothetical protein CSA57_13750 [candidate division KSB3 bacterium]